MCSHQAERTIEEIAGRRLAGGRQEADSTNTISKLRLLSLLEKRLYE